MSLSTETILVLRVLLPSYCIALLGYGLGRWDQSLHRKTISDLIYYVFSTCLIFSSLYKRVFNPREFLVIGAAAVALIALMFPLAWLFKWRQNLSGRGFYLPVVFMSTGTISLPIALLLYGNEGLAKAVIFHTVNILLLYSLGPWLVSGKAGFGQFLRIPAVHAAALGILVSVTPTLAPPPVQEVFWLALRGIDLVAYGAIPLMILTFGYALTGAERGAAAEALPGALLRIIGGPLMAAALVWALRAGGLLPMEKGYDLLRFLDFRTTEAVIILNAAMPGPIMSYMLALKFDADPGRAASILALGTVGGLVTVPVVLHLINLFVF